MDKLENNVYSPDLIEGLNHHDRSLSGLCFSGDQLSFDVRDDCRLLYRLVFEGISNVVINNYFPENIIKSMFAWKLRSTPEWVKKNGLFASIESYSSIDSEFVFYLESSYGVSMLVPFRLMRLCNEKCNG